VLVVIAGKEQRKITVGLVAIGKIYLVQVAQESVVGLINLKTYNLHLAVEQFEYIIDLLVIQAVVKEIISEGNYSECGPDNNKESFHKPG
jgi:hypothetical protein